MTLRDEFAARAPTMTIEVAAKLLGWPIFLPMGDDDGDEFVDSKIARWKVLSVGEQASIEARWAFIMADALMAERERGMAK